MNNTKGFLEQVELNELREKCKKQQEFIGTLSRFNNTKELLIAWEQFKKANWWESEAVDVEKVLMDNFQVIYNYNFFE